MFISRKRYEKELENARCEGAEKVWKAQADERRFAELNERIERMGIAIHNIEQQINTPLCVELKGDRRC